MTMGTAYDIYHRRTDTLREVEAELERNAGSELPWNDAIAAVFADRSDLLLALHSLWSRRLLARVEVALELAEDIPLESVAAAWRELAGEMPAVLSVLEANVAQDALAHAERHQNRHLAVAAGLVALDTPLELAALAGAQLVRRLHGTHLPAQRASRIVDRAASAAQRTWQGAMYVEAAARA